MLKKLFIVSLVLLAIGAACLVAIWNWSEHYFTTPNQLTEDVTVIVPNGASLSRIAELLAEENVIRYPRVFTFIIQIKDKTVALQAGEYRFESRISPSQAFNKLVTGETYVRQLTIPEGLSTPEALEIINNSYGLLGEIPQGIQEGTLLPETYHYHYSLTKDQMIKRMQQAMRQVVDELWEGRAENLPFKTIQEALTLASIVEKETGVDAERERVAAVFINRLRKNMRLQSDPTVIYALTKGEYPLGRSLTKKDLQVPSEYNTYVTFGLPPAPIANPGQAAIAAVLNPIESDEYYFVANGTGGHAFSKTLKEHNRNVSKWRKIERERKLSQPTTAGQ